MPTFDENAQQIQFEQMRLMLNESEELSARLAGELSELGRREDAGARILAEIKSMDKGRSGQHVGDAQRATAGLLALKSKRDALELRMRNAKHRQETLKTQMADVDQSKLKSLDKISGLFRQLAG
jgi:hypothetical protein